MKISGNVRESEGSKTKKWVLGEDRPEHRQRDALLERNARLPIGTQLISTGAGVDDADTALTANVPGSSDGRAVLSLAFGSAPTAGSELNFRIQALIVARDETRKRAGAKTRRAKRDTRRVTSLPMSIVRGLRGRWVVGRLGRLRGAGVVRRLRWMRRLGRYGRVWHRRLGGWQTFPQERPPSPALGTGWNRRLRWWRLVGEAALLRALPRPPRRAQDSGRWGSRLGWPTNWETAVLFTVPELILLAVPWTWFGSDDGRSGQLCQGDHCESGKGETHVDER